MSLYDDNKQFAMGTFLQAIANGCRWVVTNLRTSFEALCNARRRQRRENRPASPSPSSARNLKRSIPRAAPTLHAKPIRTSAVDAEQHGW